MRSFRKKRNRIKIGSRKPLYIQRNGIMLGFLVCIALSIGCTTTHNFRFNAEDVTKPAVVYTDSLSIILPR